MNAKRFILFVICFIFFVSNIFALDTVIYPQSQSGYDTRYNDLIEILEVSLEKTRGEYGSYELRASDYLMNELRVIGETEKGINVNIMWRGADTVLENRLIPIYIPTRRGILGYRIFLIRKEMQDEFSNIKKLEDLKKYFVGQGIEWPDVEVFKHNGFKVVGGTAYEGLFGMLSLGRFDFFSRGVNEAYPEYEERKGLYKNLHVEEDLVLYYPWPYLFYISPKLPRIAERIEKGMQKMIEDGSLERIFEKYNGETIKKSDLKNRRIFRIENPNLSKNLPLDDESLWFDPYK